MDGGTAIAEDMEGLLGVFCRERRQLSLGFREGEWLGNVTERGEVTIVFFQDHKTSFSHDISVHGQQIIAAGDYDIYAFGNGQTDTTALGPERWVQQ